MEQSLVKKTRRRFDQQLKVDAVRLSEEGGKTVAEVAQNLGVTRNQSDRWRRELRATTSVQAAFPGNGNLGADKKELEELRRELARVKEEREIVKKSYGRILTTAVMKHLSIQPT